MTKTLMMALGLMAAVTLGCEKKEEAPAMPDKGEVEAAAEEHADGAHDAVAEAAEAAGDAVEEAVEEGADAAKEAMDGVKLPE